MITWAILTVRAFDWTVRNDFHLWILFSLHLSMLSGECECNVLLICFLFSSFKQQFSLLTLMCVCWITEVLSWKIPPPELWLVTLISHTLHTLYITTVEVSFDIVTLLSGRLLSIEIFHKMILGDIRTEWLWYFPRQGLSFGADTLVFKCHVNRVLDNSTCRYSTISGTGSTSG